MARKITPQGSLPPPGRHKFWLTQAFRARDEGDQTEDPLPATHARHVLLRHGVRRSSSLKALVNYGLIHSDLRKVRDLSPTDAFVEMSPTNLSVGSEVEFVLRYRYQGRPIELRLSATVKRIEPDGVALQFGKYDDITYTDLVNLLYVA